MEPGANGVAVVADDVELAWGRRTVLRDLSFTIPAGRLTALIGPNGAGKSTLLHAMAGLLRPRRGTLTVPGRADERDVAIVLQATAVNEHLPLTVREAVTIGRYGRAGLLRRLGRDDRAAIDDAMALLGVAPLARRQLHELSGGQRQRVFVAQALAQQASVLLLDEPLTGLDLVSRDRIATALVEMREAGRTVIVSTHDLAEAAGADHVLLLAGSIVAAGPPADVLTPETLATAFGGQLLQLGDRTVLLDDPHHHTSHAHDGHTGPLGHHGHEH